MALSKAILLALLSASSFTTVLSALKTSRSDETSKVLTKARHSKRGAPNYYSGPYYNFPAMSTWVDFSTMFNNYESTMVDAGSTWDDVGRIAVAIEGAAQDIGVDERVILGIILEESSGYVGVETTYDADGNPTGGLMQAEGCAGYDGQSGLPQGDTTDMVYCGTQYYKGYLEQAGNLWDISSIYPALREYNSGDIDESNLSDAPGDVGNPYYVSDIAQRMQGYVF